jgi:SPFH domain / Band 7 family
MAEAKHYGNLNASTERPVSSFSGYLMAVIALALFFFTVWEIVRLTSAMVGLGHLPLITFAIIGFLIIVSGFYMLQPNQAASVTLFGAYRGTDRTEGLRWVWPWMGKAKISLRSNNLISDKIKINDLRGNPIEIAAQVVWRVTDTAQALFDVDDYKAFVMAQVEAAVRAIGSRYPYDDIEHKEVTLRGNHDEVGKELRIALTDRLAVAGISVDECGFTHLPCSGGNRRRLWSPRGQLWSKGPSAWSKWHLSCSPKRASSISTMNARQQWSPT